MKKLAAILLALAMLFTLAACGEKDNDSDPNLGRYEGTTIEAMGVTMNLSDIYEGENYVELKSGGKCVMTLEGDAAEGTWTLNGENITITIEGIDSTGTLKDGTLVVDFMEMGMPMTFVKGGASAPKTSTADVSETEEPTIEVPDAPYAWWEGDWYGWWVVTSAGGEYADWESLFWDACARVILYDDTTGNIQIWDEDCEADEYMIDADVSFGSGTTEYGCMMSESGYFWDCEIGHADWIIDPGASQVSSLDQMICIDGTYSDPESNGENWFNYAFYLRPWGMDWEDVRNADTTDLPYDDMMPGYYDDWYLPLIEAGVDTAPATIGETVPTGGSEPGTSGGSEPGAPIAGDGVLDYNDAGVLLFNYPTDVFTYDDIFNCLETEDGSLCIYFTAAWSEEEAQQALAGLDSYSDYEDFKKEELSIAGFDATRITYNMWGDYYVDTYISFGESSGQYYGVTISARSYNSYEECLSPEVESVIYSIQLLK